jgi:pimeloyl-ACP methyl ester carboxylesterase
MNPLVARFFAARRQTFLISAFTYDPLQLLRSYKGPVLILQGLRDRIAGERDARLLASADPAAKLVLLADVNTIFRTVTSDDPKANAATYGDPTLTLAPGVIDAITGFLAQHPAP